MNEQKTQCIYEFGDFRIETDERLLKRNGEVIHLPPKVIDLLFVLVESGGRVLTKDALMQRVWADSFVEETNLTHNISLLRRVLGEKQSGEKFIETIPRRGYRFVAPVSRKQEDENLEIIARQRTVTNIVSEEEIETDNEPETKIAVEAHSPTLSAPALNLPSVLSRKKTVVALVPLSILIIGGIVAGYFALQSRRISQNAPLTQQRLVSTFAGSHTAASFSPNGERIAFINEADGVPQVWIKNLSGGEPVQVTFGEERAERPRWSPVIDNEIVYVRNLQGKRGIWRIILDGGEPQKIIEGGRNPNWSSDGRRLLFERGYDIWTANKDGSEQRRVDGVPPTDLLLADRMPAFSPDGSSIAFFQNDKGPIGDYWIIPTQGGEAKRLTFDNIFGGAPVWTSDGESVIFPSQRAGSMTLWRVPAAGGQPEPVLTSAGEDTEPEISRDGRKLIYTNTRNSHVLTVSNPATGKSRELKESRVDIVDPTFSHDGSKILFFGISEQGDIQIFTIEADGKNLTQVTRGKGERNIHPQWAADGSSIYFYQFHPTLSFRKISADGGEESMELVSGWQWGTHNGARVDPQGRRVIYSKMDKGGVVAAMIRDFSDGTETAFALPLRHLRWSRDGMFIAGAEIPGGRRQLAEIIICQVEGGSCRSVAKGTDPHWSADGSHIYYTVLADFDGESVWTVFREGGDEKKVMDLRSMHPIGHFFDVSPQNEIVWVQYRRGKHEMWMADFPTP